MEGIRAFIAEQVEGTETKDEGTEEKDETREEAPRRSSFGTDDPQDCHTRG